MNLRVAEVLREHSFGMKMDERTYSNTNKDYRFYFNGIEKDDLAKAKLGFKPFHVEKSENRENFLFEDQIDHIKQSGRNICLIKAELIDQYAKSIPDDCAKKGVSKLAYYACLRTQFWTW
ncbi:MAG: hypothetical protein GC181_10980 [Bacteroidetes bacterium]|nr:hypothetical protein [Bacteroidota bacterium]